MIVKPIKLKDDILELDGIEEIREEQWNHYCYEKNSNGVPRVSNILAQCRSSEWLIQWAANIGRRKYDYYRSKALDIGTIVHECVDNYLIDVYSKHSVIPFAIDYDEIQQEYKESVYNCFENFKLWEKRLYNLGGKIDEIIGLEVPVTCPWYGGTIDCIARINGAVYIIDFKTSKQISAEYLLQVTAYMWIINNNYAPYLPHIDGVGVIRMDKSKYGVVDDYFLNDFDPDHHNMIVNYQNCFMEYVNAFYRTINAEHIFDKYKETYNPEKIYGVS